MSAWLVPYAKVLGLACERLVDSHVLDVQHIHAWTPARGEEGALAPLLEFEIMTSYAALLRNNLKFSLAPSALAIITLKFSLTRRKTFRLRQTH